MDKKAKDILFKTYWSSKGWKVKSILTTIRSCNPEDYPGTLRDKLKDIPNLKSNKNERYTIIEILACIEVLKPMSYDRPVRGKID